MSKLPELFAKLDVDKTGSISKSELKNGLTELDMTVDDTKIDSFFSVVDVDGDGEISKGEFMAFVSTHNPDNSEFLGIYQKLNQALPVLKRVSKVTNKSELERRVIFFKLVDN